jgi:hypothetical protein
MNYAAFLARRLSQPGCIVAGTKLRSQAEKLKAELKEEKQKLVPKVETAIANVIARTQAVEALTSTDATMNEVDRATDRNIASTDDQLEAIESSFDHTSILPLTKEQAVRLADARLVRGALLPNGTSFLRLPYSEQWVRMTAMLKALGDKDVAAAVKRLGMEPEMGRLRAWVDLYGAKLGVTEAKDTDPAAVAVDAWHAAYGELMVRVHDAYDDARSEQQEKIRRALVAPYDRQVEEERRAEQKARVRRTAQEPPAAEG